MSTILTLTTPPLTLADGIEKGLGPLKKIKVPVHELGLMLSISLRFIPTLMDDTTMIMNAQKARGMDFGEGNLLKKIKSVIPILIPLFVPQILVNPIDAILSLHPHDCKQNYTNIYNHRKHRIRYPPLSYKVKYIKFS